MPVLHRVVVAIEQNLKPAVEKLPPDAEIVSQVVDVRKILEEPSSDSEANEIKHTVTLET